MQNWDGLPVSREARGRPDAVGYDGNKMLNEK